MPTMSNVDINDLSLAQEVCEVDGQVSSKDFFQPPIPDDGTYDAVLHLGDRGAVIGRQKDKATGQKTGGGFVNVHVQAKILNDQGQESMSCFDNLTTVLMGGMSRLHAVMDLAGSPLPNRATFEEIRDAAVQWLAQNPRVKITTQWLAEINRGTKDKADYATLAKGQRRFPPVIGDDGQPTGKYEREVTDPKTGDLVSAQVKVTKYDRP